ncbi:MAG: DUF4157 domain-containing protein [Bacteroidota bacterium]
MKVPYGESKNKQHRSIDTKPEKTGVARTIEDNRFATAKNRAAAAVIQRREKGEPLSDLRTNRSNTGLPDQLKSGIEGLSGYAMNDVKVHYNSSKPTQLNALAYAQGTNIHLGPGQEKYLPHEAWHVVQQKQGRVKPTLQFRKGLQINDDTRLEREADVMGEKALQYSQKSNSSMSTPSVTGLAVMQLKKKKNKNEKKVEDFFIRLRDSSEDQLNLMTIVLADGLGDAGQIRHLYEAVDRVKSDLGIRRVTLNAFVKNHVNIGGFKNDEESEKYAKPHKDHPNENSFASNPEGIKAFDSYEQRKTSVINLLQADTENIRWKIVHGRPSTRTEKKQEEQYGIEARNQLGLSGKDWEIQFPVMTAEPPSEKVLKITEMNFKVALNDCLSTGLNGEGIGFAIPDLVSDHTLLNVHETDLLYDLEQELKSDLDDAWMVSFKTFHDEKGINVIQNSLDLFSEKGDGSKVLFLPGKKLPFKNLKGYQVLHGVQYDNMTLITMKKGNLKFFVVAGTFRNEFMQYAMSQMKNGVIISGGEGLYAESMAVDGLSASIMAPRYHFQFYDLAAFQTWYEGGHIEDLASTQTKTSKGTINRIQWSELFVNHGLCFYDGMLWYFRKNERNKGQKGSLHSVSNPQRYYEVTENPLPEKEMKKVYYSDRLTALYLPLSLNSTIFNVVPKNYDFKLAIEVFRRSKAFIREEFNWFNIIKEVAKKELHEEPEKVV